MNSALRLISLAYISALVSLGQVNVLTAGYDTDRTNSNNSETILNPTSVNALSFGKLGAFPVDGEIYAQPLYVSGVSIAGQLRDVVYVATMHDSVYAFDADAIGAATPLWTVNLGASIPSSTLNFTDVDVEVGILSTPVIDLGRQAIYVVSDTLENGNPTFRLHALSLVDGHEIERGPVVIEGSVAGTGDGGQTVQFDAQDLLQRPGLALLDRDLYIAFGSHADDLPWHGWIFAYDASNLQHQLAIFCTTPNGLGSSIWQSGRAPAIDLGGGSGQNVARVAAAAPIIQNDASLYFATGNGDYDGATNFGESILRLSPTNLAVVDWFTPDNWADLNENDWDLGSSGVILVPGTNLLVTAGKSGNVYLAPRTAMGHLAPANSTTTQSFNVNSEGIWNTALWNNRSGPTVYVVDPFGGPLLAFQIANGLVNPRSQSQTPTFPTTYSGIAISSNGGQDGTGILWLTTGDFTQTPAPGTLNAFDANDLTHLSWSSTTLPDRDAPGSFAKFATPTVANGKVFVPTFSNQLVVYGLLPPQPSRPKDIKR
jgi:hypothetical protein